MGTSSAKAPAIYDPQRPHWAMHTNCNTLWWRDNIEKKIDYDHPVPAGHGTWNPQAEGHTWGTWFEHARKHVGHTSFVVRDAWQGLWREKTEKQTSFEAHGPFGKWVEGGFLPRYRRTLWWQNEKVVSSAISTERGLACSCKNWIFD